MLSKFIQKLRKKNIFTQEYLASKLDISRPTYIEIEQGKRDLTIPEAQKLADVFCISLDNFLNERDVSINVKIQTAKSTKKENEIRISVPQKNLKKFKEVLLYILTKIGSKPNVGESVLNKLFYFIDFDYYEKFEEQLIGATYIKNHYGPTPCEFVKILEDMRKNKEIEEVKSNFFKYEQKKYLPHRPPDLTVLSAQELEHIDDVLNRLGDKTAKELMDYSHEDIPWKIHKDGEKISYESVFYRDSKYSVKTFDDEL